MQPNKRHGRLWTWLFLGVTATALGMEIFASTEQHDSNWAWTNYIVEYIPGEVTAFAIAGLSGWLAVHFYRRYKAKNDASEDGRESGD